MRNGPSVHRTSHPVTSPGWHEHSRGRRPTTRIVVVRHGASGCGGGATPACCRCAASSRISTARASRRRSTRSSSRCGHRRANPGTPTSTEVRTHSSSCAGDLVAPTFPMPTERTRTSPRWRPHRCSLSTSRYTDRLRSRAFRSPTRWSSSCSPTWLIEPVLVDDHGEVVGIGRRGRALSSKIMRAVLLRDGHCRVPGCERRHGLQIHHMVPVSWGGTDAIANLATVCTGGVTDHHATLVPHGPWVLLGNPNQPDGLELVHRDDLTDEQAARFGLPPPDRPTG